MENKLMDQSIDELKVNNEIINKLKENHINTFRDLCKKRKSNLLKMGIEKEIVDFIEIELQLKGLMLKGSL